MRLIFFFILLLPFAFAGPFKTPQGTMHNNHIKTSFKTPQEPIDTNIVVSYEGKPLRYYQYIKYLKAGTYTLRTYQDFTGDTPKKEIKLVKLSGKELNGLKMDAASIEKRIAALLFKPVKLSLAQIDTTIVIYNKQRPLRYYQYMPLLVTGNYYVQMDSGKRSIAELTGLAYKMLSKDNVSLNNSIVNWLSRADRIVVEKAKRRLYVQRNGKCLFDFPINLGKAPVGHKLKEGDGRTPEGLYYLDYNINLDASYHLGFHISYPNADDIARAKKQGFKPGGDIMIHGTSQARSKLKDWTNGCIAVANNHLDTIMKYQYRTIPIEIMK